MFRGLGELPTAFAYDEEYLVLDLIREFDGTELE